MKTKMTSRFIKPRFVVDAIEQRVLLAGTCTWDTAALNSSWSNPSNWIATDGATPATCATGDSTYTYVFSGAFANQPTLDVANINALELQFFGDSPITLSSSSSSNTITLATGGFIKFGQATVTTPVAHTVAPNIAISGSDAGATIVHYTSLDDADTTLTLSGAITGSSIPLHVTSVDGAFTPAATGGFVTFGNTGNTFGALTVDNLAGSLGTSTVGGRVQSITGTAITIDQSGNPGYLGQGAISLNKGTLNLPSTGTLTWTSGTLTASGGAKFTATSTTDVVLSGGAMTFNGENTTGLITADTTLSAQAGFTLTETAAASVTLNTENNLTWTGGTLTASDGATFTAESTLGELLLNGGSMTFSGANTQGSIIGHTALSVEGNFTLTETAAASVTLNTENNLTWTGGTVTASDGATFSASSTSGELLLDGGSMNFSGENTTGSIIGHTALSVAGDFTLTETTAASVTMNSLTNVTWTSGTLTAQDGATFSASSTSGNVALNGGSMTFDGSGTIGSITGTTTLSDTSGFTLNETTGASVTLTSGATTTLNGAYNVNASTLALNTPEIIWESGTLSASAGSAFSVTATGAVTLTAGSMTFDGSGTTGSITATTTLSDASGFTLNETTGAVVTLKSGTSTTLNGNHDVNASTLTLESSDAFSTSTPTTGGINLTAGTLKFVAAANIDNALGLPILSLGAGASKIDFSGIPADAASNSTAITVAFGNSSAATWDGTLGINDWNSGPRTVLSFGADNNGLTATQVNKINSWANIQNVAGITSGVGSRIDSAGEVIPLLSLSPTYAAALVAINTYLGCYPSPTVDSDGISPWVCTGICAPGVTTCLPESATGTPIRLPVGAISELNINGLIPTGSEAANAIYAMVNQILAKD
jgi:hypothetical protein